MKTRIALMLILLSTTVDLHGAEFFVSPQGNDNDPGTLNKPFKTIQRARNAARELKTKTNGEMPEGGITVWLRGGRYELAEPLQLGPEDSGQQGRPMVYRSYENEQPLLSGGRVIGEWKKVEGALPGLPAAALGKVWVANVPSAKDGKWPFRQLWLNNKRLTRARWPNLSAAEEVKFKVLDATGNNPPVGSGPAADQWKADALKSWRRVQFRPEDLKAFPDGKLPADLASKSVELFTRNRGRWATMRIPIEKVDGAELRSAVILGCLSYYWGNTALLASDSGHIENALSLLDEAGEWYLDSAAGQLYYYPSDGQNPADLEFFAPQLEQLVQITGTAAAPVKFVELRGVRLEHAEWPMPEFGYRPTLGCFYGTQMTPMIWNANAVGSKPGSLRPADEFPEYALASAVTLKYAQECSLELCRVGRVGGTGIGLAEGCRANRIVGCEVFDAGGNGIHVGAPSGPICGEDFAWKTPEDEPQGNQVLNCHIHHNGHMDWGGYGILNSYSRGTRIAHNLIEQQPYSGLCATFTWFAFPSGREEEVTVEYNYVHHVMLKLFDGGAIYTKDGVAKTSVIRGNLLHDIGGKSIQNNGIFLDDGSYGFHIEENIIYGVQDPVRFNLTKKENFTWGKNYFNVTDYPPELAKKAGLEEPYRSLLLGK